jgi:hypothetical protein
MGMKPWNATLSERLQKVGWIVDPDLGCWFWRGQEHRQGWAQVSMGKRVGSVTAARVAYQAWVGPVPPGRQYRIIQTCGQRMCIRPDHLELRGNKGVPRRTPVRNGPKLSDDEVARLRALVGM